VYLLLGLGVCLFANEIVAILGGSRYQGAASIIAPVVVAYFFLNAADMADAGFYLRRRTALKFVVLLTSTALTVLLYALLIPRYGAMGAALATLGGFIFHAAATWNLSQRIFFVRYEYGRLFTMLGLACCLWLFALALPGGPLGITGKAVLWSLWPMLLWAGNVLSSDEKQWLQSLLRKLVPAGPPADLVLTRDSE
jgi:O-antigen/teichoic acid export membrane protein